MSIIGILASNLFSAGARAARIRRIARPPRTRRPISSRSRRSFSNWGRICSPATWRRRSRITPRCRKIFRAPARPAAVRRLQAFAQLGKDLQAGNLQGAQQDYATVQQDAQQNTRKTRTGARPSRPPSSPCRRLAIFFGFFVAEQCDQPGVWHSGSGFAGWKPLRSAIGFRHADQRSAANRRIPYRRAQRDRRRGWALKYRQPECKRLNGVLTRSLPNTPAHHARYLARTTCQLRFGHAS